MTNQHINSYLKDSRKPASLSYDDMEEFYLYDKMIGEASGVEDEVLNSLMDTEVKEAIARLPYDFRIVLILSELEGFKYKEIAEILECPIGTVRSRLSRARRLLDRYLWDYAKERHYFGASCKLNGCREAVDNLVDYIHEEFDHLKDKTLKEHIRHCRACCSRIEFEQKLMRTVREKILSEEYPDNLKKRIMNYVNNII